VTRLTDLIRIDLLAAHARSANGAKILLKRRLAACGRRVAHVHRAGQAVYVTVAVLADARAEHATVLVRAEFAVIAFITGIQGPAKTIPCGVTEEARVVRLLRSIRPAGASNETLVGFAGAALLHGPVACLCFGARVAPLTPPLRRAHLAPIGDVVVSGQDALFRNLTTLAPGGIRSRVGCATLGFTTFGERRVIRAQEGLATGEKEARAQHRARLTRYCQRFSVGLFVEKCAKGGHIVARHLPAATESKGSADAHLSLRFMCRSMVI
jgi:hypothetical protein